MLVYNIYSPVVRLCLLIGLLGFLFLALTVQILAHPVQDATAAAWLEWLTNSVISPMKPYIDDNASEATVLIAYMALCFATSFFGIKLDQSLTEWRRTRQHTASKAKYKKRTFKTPWQQLQLTLKQQMESFYRFKHQVKGVASSFSKQSYVLMLDVPFETYPGLLNVCQDLYTPYCAHTLSSPSNSLWLVVSSPESALNLSIELFESCQEQIRLRSLNLVEKLPLRMMIISIDSHDERPELSVVNHYDWLNTLVPNENIVCTKRLFQEMKRHSQQASIEPFGRYLREGQQCELFVLKKTTHTMTASASLL
jgi:hypothetical protein